MLWYHKFIGLTASMSLAALMAHGQVAQINKIGAEEFVANGYMDRPAVSTDSKNQPHFVADCGGNPSFMKFHKVGKNWSGGIFAVGTKGGKYNAGRLYIGQIEIDGKDRAWISCKFGAKEFGVLGQGIWLFRDVANDPTPPEQFFKNVNVYKGMGVVMTDAKYVDQGVVIGTFGNYNILNSYGQSLDDGSINAGHGGEKVRARIGSYAPRFPTKGDDKVYPDGIWHTAMNGSRAISSAYQSSTRYKNGQGPVTWADYGAFPIMGDDYHHPGIVADLSDPRVAYINTVFYGKMCAQIWDGSKMVFGTSFLKVLDWDCTFEPRHAPAVTPAPGTAGGAFFFWTKFGNIRGCYVSKKGVAGKIFDVGPGRSAAAATDREGNIHLVYYNGGGSRYRKLLVSTLDTIEPAGLVTGTRAPTFRWTNTKASSYTLEIKCDGDVLRTETVSGTTSWTPASDLAVGDYSWRVKEGGAFSGSAWSPAEPFVIPPATPTALKPDGRYPTAPTTPTFKFDCDEPAATRYTIELIQDGDVLDSMNVASNGTSHYEVDWKAALPAGTYAWHVMSKRVLTDHTVTSGWSKKLFFHIGVPDGTAITAPAEGTKFQATFQTIDFTWFAADGATSYKLKLVHNGATFGDPIDNIADTNQGFAANFEPGYYSALVLPKNSDGLGLWTDPVTFEVVRFMKPYNSVTLDQAPAKFTWTRSKNATRYLAKLSKYNAKTREFDLIRERWMDQTAWGDDPVWTPTLTDPNGAYRWSVTDYTGKQGHYTSVAYFQVRVPGRPDLIEPIGDVPDRVVEFSWADPSGAANEFQVEVWNGKDKIRDTGFLPASDFDKRVAFSQTFTFSSNLVGALKWSVQGRNNKGVGSWGNASITLLPVSEE